MQAPIDAPRQRRQPAYWPAALVWLLAWLAMALLDEHVDISNQALILVLAAALAALWLPAVASMVVCQDGRMKRAEYRKFRIRQEAGSRGPGDGHRQPDGHASSGTLFILAKKRGSISSA